MYGNVNWPNSCRYYIKFIDVSKSPICTTDKVRFLGSEHRVICIQWTNEIFNEFDSMTKRWEKKPKRAGISQGDWHCNSKFIYRFQFAWELFQNIAKCSGT